MPAASTAGKRRPLSTRFHPYATGMQPIAAVRDNSVRLPMFVCKGPRPISPHHGHQIVFGITHRITINPASNFNVCGIGCRAISKVMRLAASPESSTHTGFQDVLLGTRVEGDFPCQYVNKLVLQRVLVVKCRDSAWVQSR